ncbi:aspartate--ammonia ligase [Candidatus Woesearchaeota archaeon]|nr:aspartate--ammonia ligase [Candidatus Woesearchaeota archaeon]
MKQETITQYEPKLDFFETEKGIKLVKDTFERKLAEKLSLCRVTAPRFLVVGTGLQDDLAGTMEPVSFTTKFASSPVEMVHSLAKWKRWTLGKQGFAPGTGIYTDMDAIRAGEDVSEIHSIYVDQWDWERVIRPSERSLEFLKSTVRKIYSAMLETESAVAHEFPALAQKLPKEITFVHSEELEKRWPSLTPKEREDAIAKEHGAVFLIGIGHPLASGKPHDLRAADYDDWVTETADGKRGLNGDIIIWDSVRGKSLELSSMGIRVSPETMKKQLAMAGLSHREKLDFHSRVISGLIPLSVGGGIGQSRLCMALLQKAHIGEVQSSVWPEEHAAEMEEKGIRLL